MPAEWEPHEATWIAWPHHREDWPGKFGPIPWVYTEIVRHLSRVEMVNILINDKQHRNEAADRLEGGPEPSVADLLLDLLRAAEFEQRFPPRRPRVAPAAHLFVFQHDLVGANLLVQVAFDGLPARQIAP